MVRPRRQRLLLTVLAVVTAGCGHTQGLVGPSSSTCPAVPPLQTAHVSFYDQDAQKVAIYGGGMWTWDGRCWARLEVRGDAPGDNAADGLVTSDPDGQRVILFGGTGGEYRHMWAWESGRWTFLGDSPALPTAIAGAAAYDAARHQLVVVGMPPAFQIGRDDPRDFSPETWLWDGRSAWRRAQPATKLPSIARTMAFDPVSKTVLAVRPSGTQTEVWSWNGTDWRQLPGSISGIGATTLVDGGDVGVLAVETGSSLAPPGQVRKVFRVEGGQWTSIGPPTVGPSTVFVPMYDPSRQQLVAFGDVYLVTPSGPQILTQDTWTWTLAAGWTKHAGPAPSASPTPSPPPSEPGSPPASASASPSLPATPCAITTSPPAFAASPPSGRILALVTLTGTQQLVVRDITNIESPATVATPGIQPYLDPSLVNAAELAAVNAQGLARMPLGGTPAVQAAYVCPPSAVVLYGWSRDGRYLTYIAEVDDATTPGRTRFDWHLVMNGADHLIGTAPAWCHCDGETGANTLDFRVGFSPDTRYVSLVENVAIASNDLQIRHLDGTLAVEMKPVAPDSISMAVWSGGSLYYRDAKGVEAWTDGTIRPFLPGVAWIRPKASPAGGQITYFAHGSDGLGHVYVVATDTAKVVELTTASRVEPVFLSSRYIWYEGERLCTPTDTCPFYKTMPTGTTYIYDLATGTEAVSRISAVYDVWPHGS